MDTSPFTKPTRAPMPQQRWQIAPVAVELAKQLAQVTQLSPLLTQVLINRGLDTPADAQTFLQPETQVLPSPLEEFPDLPMALELLMDAIATRQPIAICGDYDADGMTSTALLLRALRSLGAHVDYAIPSRMQEGYGINRRIIEEFHQEGVRLILTVDNGIAAYDPIARARELGLTVIITDHHDLPELLPPANAILNPKLIDPASPYYGVAGVGVAYVLAVCLAQALNRSQELTSPLIELFTLGTIADLAPLIGVNRRWVRRGLKLLPKSRLAGIQALVQVAGLGGENALKPEAIGFRLGPRINAVGRIADPQIVIELLTTDDDGQALELAMKCEQINQGRQRLCEQIEQDAIAWCETADIDIERDRVLVVVQPNWHHGVIGIVASRLVERYGVPVFIGTYEEEDESKIRGSARSIPEFNVFEAMQFCGDLFDKYGGHRAAGGFSLPAEKLDDLRSRLSLFANQHLQPQHLKPLVTVDVQADLEALNLKLYNQIDALHPCGIENPDPVFWTPDVQVVDQRAIGRNQAHLKLTLAQVLNGQRSEIKAIAWRWGEYYPLPTRIDLAYRLRLNDWNGSQTVELEVIGARSATQPAPVAPFSAAPDSHLDQPLPAPDRAVTEAIAPQPTPIAAPKTPSPAPQPTEPFQPIEFSYKNRPYTASFVTADSFEELQIQNSDGQILSVQLQQNRGVLWTGQQAKPIDPSQPHYSNLIQTALTVVEAATQQNLLQEKDQLLSAQATLITLLQQQIQLLEPLAPQLPPQERQQLQTLQTELKAQEQKMAHLQTTL